jgi:hypothetical protein
MSADRPHARRVGSKNAPFAVTTSKVAKVGVRRLRASGVLDIWSGHPRPQALDA